MGATPTMTVDPSISTMTPKTGGNYVVSEVVASPDVYLWIRQDDANYIPSDSGTSIVETRVNYTYTWDEELFPDIFPGQITKSSVDGIINGTKNAYSMWGYQLILTNMFADLITNYTVEIKSIYLKDDSGAEATIPLSEPIKCTVLDNRNFRDYIFLGDDQKVVSGSFTYNAAHVIYGTIRPVKLSYLKYGPSAKLDVTLKVTGEYVYRDEYLDRFYTGEADTSIFRELSGTYIYRVIPKRPSGMDAVFNLSLSVRGSDNLNNLTNIGVFHAWNYYYASAVSGSSNTTKVEIPLYYTYCEKQQIDTYWPNIKSNAIFVEDEAASTAGFYKIVAGSIYGAETIKFGHECYHIGDTHLLLSPSATGSKTFEIGFSSNNPDFAPEVDVDKISTEGYNPFFIKNYIDGYGITTAPMFYGSSTENAMYKFWTSYIDTYIKFKYDATFAKMYGFFQDSANLTSIKTFPLDRGVDNNDVGESCHGLFNIAANYPDTATKPSKVNLGFIIEDSRGVQGRYTLVENADMLTYLPSKITSFTAKKCTVDGTIDDEGEYVKAVGEWSFSMTGYDLNLDSVRCLDTSSLTVYDPNSVSEGPPEPLVQLMQSFESATDYIFGDGLVNPESQYTVVFVLNDLLGGSATSNDTLDPAYSTVEYLAGGKGITFGGNADREGFVCKMPSFFENSVSFEGDVNIDSPNFDISGDITTKDGKKIIRSGSLNPVLYVKSREATWIKDPIIPPHSEQDSNNWNPVLDMKTANGDWSIGRLSKEEGLKAVYISDSDYDANTNNYKIGMTMLPDRTELPSVTKFGSHPINFDATYGFSVLKSDLSHQAKYLMLCDWTDTYPVVLMPDGSNKQFLRMPKEGVIPNAIGTGQCGTSSWPWLNIYGKNIYQNGYKVNDLSARATLASGLTAYITASQTYTFSQSVQNQPNGILLIWSWYSGSAANTDINIHFISRDFVRNWPGYGLALPLTASSSGNPGNFSYGATKYVYINNTTIKGHTSNSQGNAAHFVLRSVYGV